MAGTPQLVVLSLDGLPHGLLMRLMARGDMPIMADLCTQCGPPRMMRSALPTVSAVAWAGFLTGCNPGRHGVFGFVDRRKNSYELRLVDADDLREPTIWDSLSRCGKSVFAMNVPCSCPPRPINGILIGDFLTPAPDKLAYPQRVCNELKDMGYRVDFDPWLARRDKRAMLHDLDDVLGKRSDAILHFLGRQRWDFFHAHIMETDRLNHFLLRQAEDGRSELARAFLEFYRKVDALVGRVLDRVGAATPLIVCSDHGFCLITYEVNLSRYLVETGWTVASESAATPLAIDAQLSRAFCLIPGRVYVNLRGREACGCVAPEDYDRVREGIARDLQRLRDPQGRPVIRAVLKREEVYWPRGKIGRATSDRHGAGPSPFDAAPDLLAVPLDGYDLKMGPAEREMFIRTELEGMHTYGDAFVLARGVDLPPGDFEIRQMAAPVLESLGVPAEQHCDEPAAPVPAGLAGPVL